VRTSVDRGVSRSQGDGSPTAVISVGRYSSLADSGDGVCLLLFCVSRSTKERERERDRVFVERL
jgi:hypothetical protein